MASCGRDFAAILCKYKTDQCRPLLWNALAFCNNHFWLNNCNKILENIPLDFEKIVWSEPDFISLPCQMVWLNGIFSIVHPFFLCIVCVNETNKYYRPPSNILSVLVWSKWTRMHISDTDGGKYGIVHWNLRKESLHVHILYLLKFLKGLRVFPIIVSYVLHLTQPSKFKVKTGSINQSFESGMSLRNCDKIPVC